MKAIATLSSKGYLYSLFTFSLFLMCVLPLQLQAQSLDSRAGDEAALEDLYVSMNRPGMEGWSTDMSLDNNIEGVTVATIGGELRVTEIDLRLKGLTGSIDNESLANLKELTLWNSALNNFDTQYPSAIHQIGASLEYLYITYSNGSGNLDPYMPHEWAAPDGPAGNRTSVHQGKWQGDERSVIRGSVPDDIDNLTNLKYFHMSWTDDWGTTRRGEPVTINGIQSVSENIWNINTLESISLYENWNIGESGNTFSFPNSIAHLTELKFVYFGGGTGSDYDNFATHHMIGGPPSDLGELTQIRAWKVEKESNFSGPFPDLRNSPDLEILHIQKTGMQGTMPSWMWDGRFVWLDSFATSHPVGDKMSGTFPAVDPDAHGRLDNFAIARHEFSGTVPVGLWDADISKVNIGQNNFTSLGKQDFTGTIKMSLFHFYENDIEGEPIPYVDWTQTHWNRIRFDRNRYVFQDMLYVPPNSPNGETALELYFKLENDAGMTDLGHDNQRPAGPTNGYTYNAGNNIVIDDHEETYGHADNSYQWQKDGVNISDGSKYSGTNTKTLTISNSDSGDEGTYELVVTNSLFASLASTYGKSNQTLRSRPIIIDISGEGSNGDVPDAPNLTSPQDGATDITTTTSLDWNSVSSADSYRLQVATTSDFSSTVTDASGLTATQSDVGTLNYNTVYYWRVQAANENGSSNWSTVYNFTTEQESASPPEIPTLVSPSDGATGISTSPTLDWDTADRADSYRLIISPNEDFTEPAVDRDGLSSTNFEADGLDNGTTYRWMVIAENGGGSTESEAWDFTTIVQAPAAPSLSSPDDEATAQPTALTLDWDPVSGADAYRVQVATDDGFANVTVDRDGITEGSLEVTGLDYSTTYYWRARASNQGGNGDWSEIRSFSTTEEPTTAPDTPTPDSPADGATGLSTTPILDWSSANGAETYRIQVASSSDFSTVVTDSAGLAGTEYEASLDFGTTYYWRVLASNSGGSSDWSAARSFTTGEEPPAKPFLVSPGDDANSVSTSLTLNWEASDRADSYRVLVSVDETFTDPLVDSEGISSDSFEADGLENSTTYWWKVIAENSGGSTESETWNFTTVASELSQPQLTNPSDGATGQPTTLTLSWDAVDGAETYRTQVATDETFQSPVSDETGVTATEFTVDNLESGTSYYWRVRAENADGSSSWSETRNFTTEIQVPSAPTLASPDDGATDQPTTLTLNWDPSDQADTYRVQVSSDQDFASTVFDQSDITENSQEVSGLDNSVTYYWRVSAANQAGTSGWSQIWLFTTATETPAAPLQSAPDEGAGNTSLSPTFEWEPVEGADYYILHANRTDPTEMVIEAEVSGTAYTPDGDLDPETTHHWRVRAVVDGTEGEWSPIWEFSTGSSDGGSATTPDTPTLGSPLDGATDLSTTPILDWNVADGAETYRLQVASSSDFSVVVADTAGLTGTEYEASLDFSSTYYWRVQASNADGSSDWSAGREFTTIEESPEAPTLVSPGDEANPVSTSLSLDWEASERADSYRVLVSADETFTDTVVDSAGINSDSFEAAGLDNATTYRWKVVASNSGGTTESQVHSFTTIVQAPAIPSLASPENGATDQSTTLALDWSAADRAETYSLQVATTSDFSATIVDEGGINETTREISGLDYSTTYYWRARASNQAGTGNWSETRSFTTAEEPTTAPDAPTLDAPADGATDLLTTPLLDWSASDGAETYRLQVASGSDFSTVITDSAGLAGTEYEARLDFSSTYYWRVQASNTDGSSDWSAARSFATGEQSPPAVPLLLNPNDGVSVTTSPVLDWEAAARANTYRIQLSVDSSFTGAGMVTDSSGVRDTEWQTGTLNTSAQYFWRVQAVNDAGSSDWTEVYDFSTSFNNGNAKGPNPPGKSKPADKETDVSQTTQFEWEAVEADSYTIQVSNASSGETAIEEEVYDTLFTHEQDLEANTVYQWRLKASKDGIEGEWSAMWEFTTGSDAVAPPSAPVLVSPANGAQNIALTPAFEWSSVDADHYILQVISAESTEAVIETEVQAATYTVGEELNPETQYSWRVRAVKEGIEGEWSTEWTFTTEPAEEIETSLGQNYPNPFNPSTQIRFTLAETQQVSLKVYDTVGRVVTTIVEGTLTSGSYERTFQADNLASGVYFIRFVTENRVLTSQMTLMK